MKNKILVSISLALNIFFVAIVILFIIHKGGLDYLESKIHKNPTSTNKIQNPLILVKEDTISINNSMQSDIVFLGDSHTDYFE